MSVNFIHKLRQLHFKVEKKFFLNTFHGKILFTLRVFAREAVAEDTFFHTSVFIGGI